MSKEDKDLVVAKKNIFSRILSALINSLRNLFRGKKYGTGEFYKTQKEIDALEDELKEMEAEEKRLDKEAQKEDKEVEQQEAPVIEDISLHLKNMKQDWTKEASMQIGNKKVDFKEKVAPNGNKSAYYAINGIEVLSMIENEIFKHTKLINYHFDTKIVDKFGVPMNEEIRNPDKDSYQEEYTDYENKRSYKKMVGPLMDMDKNVVGDYKIIQEHYQEGKIKSRYKTEQNIRDIETGEKHKIFEERVYGEDVSTYLKKVDGCMAYRETTDNKAQEVTIELFDKEGNVYQSHKFDREGELIATFDANGVELFEAKVDIVDGKEEILNVPKKCQEIEKMPSRLNADKFNKEDWNNYATMTKKIGIDFKVPEDYYYDLPISGNSLEIVNEAKAQMKQKDANRPRIEMKEEETRE